MKKGILRSIPALLNTELPPPSQLLAKVLPTCPCAAQGRAWLFPDWRLWLMLPVLVLAIAWLMSITGMGVEASGKFHEQLHTFAILMGLGLGAAYLGHMRLGAFFQVLAFFIIFNKMGIFPELSAHGPASPLRGCATGAAGCPAGV